MNKFNKYQKAYTTLASNFHTYSIDMDEPDIEKSIKSFEILRELVERATPKRTIKEEFEDNRYNIYKHYCPTCKYSWVCDVPNYCPECGQALDWSEE